MEASYQHSGQALRRHWKLVCGTQVAQTLYCRTCWLFTMYLAIEAEAPME